MVVLAADTITVDTGSFLAIVGAAALAGTVAALAGARKVFIPVVVVELVLGVVIGPQALDIAHVDRFTEFFSNLGLGMLFFFAGYEIDVARIRGEPLRLALAGWAMSLAIAYTIGGVLALTGVVLSLVYVGSALSTTAIGTLIPVLSDTGELRTRFGTYLLAAGAVGEFGPILLLTLVLSTQSALHNALILIAFVVLAVAVALLAVRSADRTIPLFEDTLEASSQLAVRWFVVLVFALALVASELGLDLLLGGFAAGLITRQVLGDREIPNFDSKLTAVAFGVFIPFFFVLSGMRLDIDALFSSVSGSDQARDLLRAVPRGARHAGARPLPPRAAPEGGPARARPVQRDAAAAGRGDNDGRRRRRAHAHVHRGRAGRRGCAVDPGRATARASHAEDRRGEGSGRGGRARRPGGRPSARDPLRPAKVAVCRHESERERRDSNPRPPA